MAIPLSGEILEQLVEVDTPTLCNVIEMFDVRPRNVDYTGPEIAARFPELPRMVGYATTARYRSATPDDTANPYAMLTEQLAAIESIPAPRVVVIQDLDEPPVGASFGGMMANMYKSVDCRGLITNGAGRDLDEIRSLDFNVYSSSRICSHAYFRMLEFNVPVTVGGLTVEPGDLLHGDGDGVTKIPAEIAERLPEVCQEYLEIEGEMAATMRAGGPESIQKAFEASRVRFQALAKKI